MPRNQSAHTEPFQILSDVIALLATAADRHSLLQSVAQYLVTSLADVCLIDLMEETNSLNRQAIATADATSASTADAIRHYFDLYPTAIHGPVAVIRTGHAEGLGEFSDAILAPRRIDHNGLCKPKPIGLQSYVCVPVIASGRSLGTITLVRGTRHAAFTGNDLALAGTVASQLALALYSRNLQEQNAREAEQRRHAEQALDHKTEELKLMFEAGQLLGSTLDPDTIYDTLRSLLAEKMDCDALVVATYNPDDQMIRCAYAWVEGKRVDATVFPPVPLAPPGRGMQSTVIHTGQPFLICDMDEQMKRNDRTYHVTPEGTVHDTAEEGKPYTHSGIMLPIKLEGKVLGVAQIMSNRKSAYTAEDVRLMEALLLQVAAASRNAYLYRHAQEEIAERKRARIEVESLNARLRRAMTETHHRVKNNLQIISAMLEMQRMEYGEFIPVSENHRIGTHVRTLATLHDLLTQQTKESAEAYELSASAALRKIAETMAETALPRRIVLEAEDIRVQVRQATALAMVLNELVSNALKYGTGDIEIRFERQDTFAVLRIRDQGPGFAEGFDSLTAAHTGMELVDMAVRWDLSGSLCYQNPPGGGAEVVVKFPVSHPR